MFAGGGFGLKDLLFIAGDAVFELMAGLEAGEVGGPDEVRFDGTDGDAVAGGGDGRGPLAFDFDGYGEVGGFIGGMPDEGEGLLGGKARMVPELEVRLDDEGSGE